MARLDIYLAGYDITDEIINRSSTSSLKLDHDTIRGTADLEIWTGAGGTGTQLALTTDYTVAGEDTRLSTSVGGGISVYTTLAIVNGAYHSTNLYVTYKTVGDYASASSSRLIQIGYKEITGNYTVTSNDRSIIVNTASAVTITLPEGLPIGFDIDIMRLVASTNAVTVARTGSDTVEGGATFITHGAFTASTLNDQRVSIQKKSSTSWKFVSGEISGSSSNQKYTKFASGRAKIFGWDFIVGNGTTANVKDVELPFALSITDKLHQTIIGLKDGSDPTSITDVIGANAYPRCRVKDTDTIECGYNTASALAANYRLAFAYEVEGFWR